MTKTKPATIAGQRVLSYVERVEKMEEERKAIGADIRDIYSEAKGNGYDVKTIRWLVQERKVDSVDRDERDSLRDTYAGALGMAVSLVQVNGLSLREAEKRTGVSKSSIHRALTVPDASQPAPLPTDEHPKPDVVPGEDARAVCQPPLPDAECGVSRAGTISATGELGVPSGRVSRSDEQETPAAREGGQERPAVVRAVIRDTLTAMEEAATRSDVVGAVGSPEGDRVASTEIDLTIPAALDRRSEARRAGT